MAVFRASGPYTSGHHRKTIGKSRAVMREKVRKCTLVLFMFLIFGTVVSAQGISEVYVTSDTLQVYFRQGDIRLEPQFRDNGERLEEFSRRFKSLLDNPESKVRSILVVSGASPEGSSTHNRYLSDNRAQVVYDYLVKNRLADAANVEIESRGVDWKGLAARVAASELPYKEEVLEILGLPEWIKKDGRIVDSRKARLMCFQEGKVWNKLFDLYFADLRGTRVMIAYNIRKVTKTDTVETKPVIVLPPEPVRIVLPVNIPPMPELEPIRIEPVTEVKEEEKKEVIEEMPKKPFYLAVKSNLLYDAAAIPNIGVEIGLGKGFTLSGSYQNIWLRDKAWTRWYRVEGFEVGVNRYFNKDRRPFRGHHIGIYGQMLTWDITIDGRGYLAERWAYGAGISYGYSMPIGRRFNLDFEIGVGYLSGNMHEYIPQDGHRVWQSLKPLDWIGPTKIGVTLQWLIGRGNSNGRRVKAE